MQWLHYNPYIANSPPVFQQDWSHHCYYLHPSPLAGASLEVSLRFAERCCDCPGRCVGAQEAFLLRVSQVWIWQRSFIITESQSHSAVYQVESPISDVKYYVFKKIWSTLNNLDQNQKRFLVTKGVIEGTVLGFRVNGVSLVWWFLRLWLYSDITLRYTTDHCKTQPMLAQFTLPDGAWSA